MVSKHAKHDSGAKVVHLEPESQRIVRAKLAKMPSAVQAVHEKGKHLVLSLLKSFFDRADDSLFELADKAQSNQEQNLYFDSMREVRVQRRTVEKRFNDALDEAFADLVSPGADTRAEGQKNFSPDALSLVDNDELEEIVAIDSTVARANKEFGESIQLISLRLDSLVPVKVYQKNNPLGPDVLSAIFMAEAKKLDIGIKAKLVLFKLFDKSVIEKLADVYSPVNEIFKEQNVLPSLSTGPRVTHGRRSDDGSAAPHPQAAPHMGQMGVPVDMSGQIGVPVQVGTAEGANVSPEVLSTLKNLLGDRVVANPSVGSQTQVAANDLIRLLSRVQHMPAVMDNQVAINVRSLLSQLQQQSGVVTKIGQVDDQVMNLVNLLFDFILEDRNLAQPMKALISRMQIPIIKVAVSDKTFFTKGSHVARKLLNEMATAAIGWQGDSENFRTDPLYKKIEHVVRRLVEEFDTDISIFSELLADFSTFLEKEKRRADVLERRTIDAEDGKAKAEVARTTVALEIEVRTQGVRLPKVVSHLIKEAWSNVLFVTALKYGYESEEWLNSLGVLEDLVWSVQIPESLEHRQRLIKLVPGLLKKLRSGLDTISYNPFEMSDLFKSLEKVHIACIRGKSGAARAKPKPQAKSEEASAKTAKVDTPAAAAPEKEQRVDEPSVPVATPRIPEPSLKDLAKAVELSEIEGVEKPPIVAKTAVPVKNNDASVAPNTPAASQAKSSDPLEPFLQQVSCFSQGAWFDMVDEKGEHLRSRLAAFIKPTGKYIFVNRNGMKVAEKTQRELAQALNAKKLRALDNSGLFDRALETVVSGLRKP